MIFNVDPKHTILTGVLNSGDTTLTFTNKAINDNSLISIYTNVYGVSPISQTQENNTLTLVFDSQSTDITVKVEVF